MRIDQVSHPYKTGTTIVLCISLQFLYVYELSSSITQTTTYHHHQEKQFNAFHGKNRSSLRQLNEPYKHSAIKCSLLELKENRNTVLQRVTKAWSLSSTSVHVIHNQDSRWGRWQTLIKTVSYPTVQPWQVTWHVGNLPQIMDHTQPKLSTEPTINFKWVNLTVLTINKAACKLSSWKADTSLKIYYGYTQSAGPSGRAV